MQQRQLPRPARAGRGPTTAARVLIPGVVATTAVVVLTAMVLAGCGGSAGAGNGVATADAGKSGGSTATTVARKDRQQSALEFARCMREHGVDMPDPQVGEGGLIKVGPAEGATPGQAMEIDEEADKACRHLLGQGLQDGADVQVDPEQQERALQFARCMREHGVDMPDPQFDGGGVGFQLRVGEGLDPSSPTFQEAREACKQYFGPADDGGAGSVQRREGA
jgi:hypothetical protein